MYVKLLNPDWTSRCGYKWIIGEWNEATGDINKPLCTNAWLHYYEHPLLAVFHNSIHAAIRGPIMVEVEVDGEIKRDGYAKAGARRMRVLRQIECPTVTTEQRLRYALLCVKTVCDDPAWNRWADGWLDGSDRSAVTAADAAARTNPDTNLIEIAERAINYQTGGNNATD